MHGCVPYDTDSGPAHTSVSMTDSGPAHTSVLMTQIQAPPTYDTDSGPTNTSNKMPVSAQNDARSQ